jgi:hypothetical protein
MKKTSLMTGALTAACAISLTLPASAQVSADDFNALKKLVEQLSDKVQKLETTHDQDQKAHDQDQQVIHQLQQQLGETKAAVTNAQQTADNVAKVQSAYPVADPTHGPMHNFTIVGDAEANFGKSAGQHSAFALADFAPIFLFRASDNVLVEAGFDTFLNNNVDQNGNRAPGSTASFSLSFGQLDYLWNDYVTVVAGDMLLPLGTYSERGAGWLNKIPDDPLVRGVLPSAGVGAQLRGSLPIGGSGQMVTYSVYGVNGPSSGASNSIANAGALDFGGNVGDTPNWHADPSGGGRIGWFYPWAAHYDVELGLSGQTGTWSDNGSHLWSAGVVDASLHLSPNFELKGEYIQTRFGSDDLGQLDPHGWWAQAGYKLAGLNLDLPYINSIELISRFDCENDGQGTKTHRYTAGYVYYFSNTLLFKGDYEWARSHGPAAIPENSIIFQLSYGF